MPLGCLLSIVTSLVGDGCNHLEHRLLNSRRFRSGIALAYYRIYLVSPYPLFRSTFMR